MAPRTRVVKRRESSLGDQYFTDVNDSIHVIEKHFELVQLIKKQMSENLASVKILQRGTAIGQSRMHPDSIARLIDMYMERYEELRRWTLPQAEFDYKEAIEEHKYDMYMGFANERWDEMPSE